VQRLRLHEHADVLAEDLEQSLHPRVLGVVRLGLLEDLV